MRGLRCSSLQAEPGNIKALLRRGTAREALGRWQEAEEDMRAALQLQPGNKEAQEGLQWLQARAGADATDGAQGAGAAEVAAA